MSRELLDSKQADILAEKTEQIKHNRKHRIEIGAEERMEKMHRQDLSLGRASSRIQAMGVCVRFDCKQRGYECDECYHFNKYEAV